ncbi:MAG: glutathione S-transferase [Bacteroidia bacterium]|jgi:glutathione S-transferase
MVQIAMKQLPIPTIDPPGGFSSEEYMAINPTGKIPSLLFDGHVLPESAVIAEFLEDRYPEPSLRPADNWQRAQMNLIIRIADTYVMDAMLPIFANLDPSTRDESVVTATLLAVDTGLDRLNTMLEPSPLAAGAEITLADLALVPILKFAEVFVPAFGGKEPFAERETLRNYWASAQREPVLAACLDEMTTGIKAALGY